MRILRPSFFLGNSTWIYDDFFNPPEILLVSLHFVLVGRERESWGL